MRAEKKLEDLRRISLERAHIKLRLEHLFTSLDGQNIKPCFYTEKKDEALHVFLLFDNGIDPDPHFCSLLEGEIFLDKKKNLCMESKALLKGKEKIIRNEILMKNVESFSLAFLGKNPPASKRERKNHARMGWRGDWPKNLRGFPSVIRLKVVQKGEEIPFAFLLPNASEIVAL